MIKNFTFIFLMLFPFIGNSQICDCLCDEICTLPANFPTSGLFRVCEGQAGSIGSCPNPNLPINPCTFFVLKDMYHNNIDYGGTWISNTPGITIQPNNTHVSVDNGVAGTFTLTYLINSFGCNYSYNYSLQVNERPADNQVITHCTSENQTFNLYNELGIPTTWAHSAPSPCSDGTIPGTTTGVNANLDYNPSTIPPGLYASNFTNYSAIDANFTCCAVWYRLNIIDAPNLPPASTLTSCDFPGENTEVICDTDIDPCYIDLNTVFGVNVITPMTWTSSSTIINNDNDGIINDVDLSSLTTGNKTFTVTAGPPACEETQTYTINVQPTLDDQFFGYCPNITTPVNLYADLGINIADYTPTIDINCGIASSGDFNVVTGSLTPSTMNVGSYYIKLSKIGADLNGCNQCDTYIHMRINDCTITSELDEDLCIMTFEAVGPDCFHYQQEMDIAGQATSNYQGTILSDGLVWTYEFLENNTFDAYYDHDVFAVLCDFNELYVIDCANTCPGDISATTNYDDTAGDGVCMDLEIYGSGGDGGPYTYSWSGLLTGSDTNDPGVIDVSSLNPGDSGSFFITVTDGQGCTGEIEQEFDVCALEHEIVYFTLNTEPCPITSTDFEFNIGISTPCFSTSHGEFIVNGIGTLPPTVLLSTTFDGSCELREGTFKIDDVDDETYWQPGLNTVEVTLYDAPGGTAYNTMSFTLTIPASCF